MSVADKLQTIYQCKKDIKKAIADKGIDIDNDLTTYADTISNLMIKETDGFWLSTKPIKVKFPGDSSETTVQATDNITIVDRTGKEWTLQEWDQKAREVNYSTSNRERPIGIGVRACGKHYCMILDQWNRSYYDVTGSYLQTVPADAPSSFIARAGLLRHGWYNWTTPLTGVSTSTSLPYTVSNYTGVFGTNQSNCSHGTAGKFNNCEIKRDKNSNGDWVVTVENTHTDFVFKIEWFNGFSTATWNAFTCLDGLGLTDFLIVYEDMYRHMFAVCSGITTNAVNGTMNEVEIRTDSDGEMRFYINGTSTGLLAKYNLNNTIMGNTINFTEAMQTAVYNTQKSKGINMNSESIKTPGSRGAEAIAVDGYWYIITPILTNGTTGAITNMNNNIPDAPAIDCIKYLREHNDYAFDSSKIGLGLDFHLYPAYLNKAIIADVLKYLYKEDWKSIELSILQFRSTTRLVNAENCWTSCRGNAANSWCVSSSGYVSYTSSYTSYVVIPVVEMD